MERSPVMQKFIDGLAKKTFGKTQTECKHDKICTICHSPVECPICGCGFRDELSKKEYLISGMCQMCQDAVFGK